MIDIENKVFTVVSTALATYDSTIKVMADYMDVVTVFPCVTIVEESNTTYQQSQDTSLKENHANIMYAINIYTNNQNGKKQKAKAIAEVVDVAMQNMNLTRTFSSAVPNIERTVYRYTLRYEGVVEKGVVTTAEGVTTTTYRIYRK